MALALMTTLTQCGKNKDQIDPIANSDAVVITLDVNGSNSRADINTSTGVVTFQIGDQIHVGSGGKYVGTLTYNGTVFSGPITNATQGSPLWFYFLGNRTPNETLASGVTGSCSVSISDQTTSLPVISAAPSIENYTASNDAYTAKLLNKCALVKFNVATLSEAATRVTGFNNMVTVDFSANTLTPTKEGAGVIKLGAGNGERWAILLPQDALGVGVDGSAYSNDLAYYGTRGAVPAIYENGFFTMGVEVSVASQVIPTGFVNGKFTINANNDQVYFSQGNLQYQASTGIWQFAEHQYDCVGIANKNISSNYDGWIDLFGWATSGWNNGNTYYQPYDYQNNGNSSTGYGYGTSFGINLTGDYANADWGVYNAISNGGNVPGQWRTLTWNEWEYVLYTRSTNSGIRYAKATVNNVNGVILVPDDWNTSDYTLNNTNDPDADFTANVITADNWVTLQSLGVVFLPAAGYRDGTSVYLVDHYGDYWSVSCNCDYGAYQLHFSSSNLYTSIPKRYYGISVRLVRPVQ